ncbi:MAG TPA: DUF899 family protein [Chthoniobacterales bacterium]|jgi:predicted dithiol-disulfide oxidoreductase (DUF899 family)|nr:DUF899 family protein [Chthoniobacterales bacterium]
MRNTLGKLTFQEKPLEGEQPFDLPELSCFLRKGNDVYHTYSTYGRGTGTTGGDCYLLDLTALAARKIGRNRMDARPTRTCRDRI